MAKTIILMRHGRDFADKLLPEGVIEVQDIARQMMEAGINPDIILHSPSPRATCTAQALAEEFRTAGKEVSIQKNDSLNNESHRIPSVIASSKENVIVIISHEADICSAIGRLTKGDITKFPSFPDFAEAVVLDCTDLRPGMCSVTHQFRPRVP